MSLATKYRPMSFDDVIGQPVVTMILKNQIDSGEIMNSYLFCGPSGDGKTTVARIFANSLNAEITELDAASHSSVEDIRDIIDKSNYAALGRKYKVFIIDECHSLSNSAWQALLLTLEDPMPRSVFIFCTTDPQKIPNTILSRVQRYNFQRMSESDITSRLKYIIESESRDTRITYDTDAIEYIAHLSNGGMRSAISMLEKVLCYTSDITVESVCAAIGTSDYDTMFVLADAIYKMDKRSVIETIEKLEFSGKDLKLFIRDFITFVLDLNKYSLLKTLEYTKIPKTYKDRVDKIDESELAFCAQLLGDIMNLNVSIKWESDPKPIIESTLLLLCMEA